MVNEIRNMKGEIIRQASSDEKWHRLSTSTWLLIGGLILFNIGCFVNPGVIDSLFQGLDVRLWPWWYFAVLILILAFSIKWFWIGINWENYDDMDQEAAMRFLRMSVAVTVILLIMILLKGINLMGFFYYPLARWMEYGESSAMAIVTLVLLLAMMTLLVYLIKEWLVTFWKV